MCKPFWLIGWLIHVDTWQKPTRHCEAIILQLKINELKKKKQVGPDLAFRLWFPGPSDELRPCSQTGQALHPAWAACWLSSPGHVSELSKAPESSFVN